MSTRGPFTRSLPYVMREALDRPAVELISAKVTSVPDARHVVIELGGATTKIPRVAHYPAVVNDVAQVLAIGSKMLALGAVK